MSQDTRERRCTCFASITMGMGQFLRNFGSLEIHGVCSAKQTVGKPAWINSHGVSRNLCVSDLVTGHPGTYSLIQCYYDTSFALQFTRRRPIFSSLLSQGLLSTDLLPKRVLPSRLSQACTRSKIKTLKAAPRNKAFRWPLSYI